MKKPLKFILILAFTFLSFYWTAEHLTDVPIPDTNEQLLLYSNHSNDDLTNTYIKAIDKAQNSILILIYGLSDRAIIYKLNKKASEGVKITIICDGKASENIKNQLNSDIELYPIFDKGLMHLKIMVIDKSFVFMGSSNLTRHSLKIHNNLVFGIYSPPLAHYVEYRANEILFHQLYPFMPMQHFIVGEKTDMEFFFLPNPLSANKILSLIDNAKKTIQVAMYTFTRFDFAEALVKAKKRGVKVEVILDRSSSVGSSKKIANFLKRNKIDLYINKEIGLNHHKFLLVDKKVLVNGSANWTKAAFNQNYDCFVILYCIDKTIEDKMELLWVNMLLDSKKFKFN